QTYSSATSLRPLSVDCVITNWLNEVAYLLCCKTSNKTLLRSEDNAPSHEMAAILRHSSAFMTSCFYVLVAVLLTLLFTCDIIMTPLIARLPCYCMIGHSIRCSCIAARIVTVHYLMTS